MIVRHQDASAQLDHGSAPTSLWGCELRELHDRLWASRGVQVVRPGGAEPISDGPLLYLLMAVDHLVEFSLDPVLRRLHWLSPPLMRLRLVEKTDENYSEFIKLDESGSFLGIERRYQPGHEESAQAWITNDPKIAHAWQQSRDAAEAHASLKGRRRELGCVPLQVESFIGHIDSDPAAIEWLARVQGAERSVSVVLPDVYEYAPGVWAHSTSHIERGAELVGPVWVGAGVTIERDEFIAGPAVLEDVLPVTAQPLTSVEWDRAQSPEWRLKPLTRKTTSRLVAKRAFDIAFSLVAILLTLPIYPFVMLAIYLQDGRPFFFAHKRQTLGGREFPCLKFRTMVNDAEKIKDEIAAENKADGPQFYMENDPRLLRVGGLLRKLQIDELPQFFNVLVGHMSVVGPRPSPDKENQYCPAWREARLSVRPGVTGLWQVRRTRAPDTDFQEWIRYDLEYAQRQSMWRDLRIIFATVGGLVASLLRRG